jgi:hypothetical protein
MKNSLSANTEKRHVWEEAKNDTHYFLKTLTKNVLYDYKNTFKKILPAVLKIQRNFRAYLKSLIEKMERMNRELEQESTRALERTRIKTLQKREIEIKTNK